MTNFLDDLRRVVRESGLSQHEVARRAGVSAPCICEFVAGKRRPGDASLDRIARVVGCQIKTYKLVAGSRDDFLLFRGSLNKSTLDRDITRLEPMEKKPTKPRRYVRAMGPRRHKGI